MYTYNRVTSICIDLSKIKLFVFVGLYFVCFCLFARLHRFDIRHTKIQYVCIVGGK